MLRRYFTQKGSPLSPYTDAFLSAADRYGLDWRLLPAISGIETSFGKAGVGTTGPFGYGSATSWGSPERAIDVAAKGLADPKGYYKTAQTIAQIAPIWAPPGAANDAGGNAGWPAAVRQFFKELGGDPNAPVRGLTGNAPLTPPQAIGGASTPSGGGSLSEGASRALQAFAAKRADQVTDTSLGAEDWDFDSFKQAVDAVNAGMTPAQPAPGAAPGAADTPIAIPGDGSQPRLSKWGGPGDHGSRALGNWQSDLAFDLGGAAGTRIHLPLTGRVVKIGGQAGGAPQFRGFGVTIDHGNGRQAFYKHLGALADGLRPGMTLNAGSLIGTLADGTGGGPHLHLGASNNSFLNSLIGYYLG
jgi:hypothetical protein